MSSTEGARLPGNFTLCEDLPGEIRANKVPVVDEGGSGPEQETVEAAMSRKLEETHLESAKNTHFQEKDNTLQPDEQAFTQHEAGQLLDPLLARLAEVSASGEKQKQSLGKLKGSIRSRGGPMADSSAPFYNTMSTISSPTDTGSDSLTPLSDLTPISEAFNYKAISSLHDIPRIHSQLHSGPNKHQQIAKHPMDSSYGLREEMTEQTIGNLHRTFGGSNARSQMARTEVWPFDDVSGEHLSDGDSMAVNYNRQSTIWGSGHKPSITQVPAIPLPSPAEIQFANALTRTTMDHSDYFSPGRGSWGNNRRSSSFQTGPTGSSITSESRLYSRRPSYNSAGSGFGRSFDYSLGHQHSTSGYTPSPIGTPLSPTATEFTSSSGSSAAVWNTHGHDASNTQQTYVSTIEPLNYRRLLERSVNCNWKYIVDKIVCNNDQQASIFLQQKLKIGTPEQKHAIVDAVVSQAYPLMVNRFGNFLVQRCFEHGTAEQIDGIANAIRGNTLALSMDAFGCHVVQKALDCVNEEFKATMVSELLRRIPETVIHRYACHVWQKLFELRWADAPPQIMKYVNEALRGRWSEVALGETGSLVVQNIFENCLEEDKRPCINEVLANIDLIAHGQFGNWCIQHICEHGAPADRSRAIDVVIHNAPEYSMDQYASKVVEKCLKIGGDEFLERYLDRVCEGRPDRPRIPLIDIASDQYGNYLVQWILQHASPTHRDQVASHIRKHMVSLRGSKFGSRVGMLCCNPIYTRSNQSAPHAGPPANTARFNRYGFR